MTDAPASTAATATPPAATPPAATPAATPPAESWFSGYQGEDLGWIQNRGYDKLDSKGAIDALFKQTRQLESYRGAPADRLLILPADMTAEGALDPVYARLGRPEKPDGYGFKAAEDKSDEAYVKWVSEFAHSLGLNKKQAEKFDAAMRSMVEANNKEADEADNLKQAASLQALRDKWKDTYDLNVQIARDTAKKLAVSDEQFDAVEKALGSSAAVIELFAKIGQKSGESPFVTGASGGHITTPEGAAARLQELQRDKAFVDKVLSGDTEANETIRRLTKIASGMRPTA